jgi:hypothetical protein
MAMGTVNEFVESIKRDLYTVEAEQYKIPAGTWKQYWSVKPVKTGWDKATTNIHHQKMPEVQDSEGLPGRESIQGYTSYGVVRTYGLFKEYSYRLIEDSAQHQVNQLRDELTALKDSMEITKDSVLADVFNYGGFLLGHETFKVAGKYPDLPDSPHPTDGLIYDGKPLFALTGNNHPSKGGGTYFNGDANALSIANLDTAATRMLSTNARNESDLKVSLTGGQKVKLVIPQELEFTARQILTQTNLTIAAATQNDPRPHFNKYDIVVNPYLTDTNAWFLVIPNPNGLVMLDRQPLRTSVVNDDKYQKVTATAYFRFGLRVGNWRYVHGSNFSTV